MRDLPCLLPGLGPQRHTDLGAISGFSFSTVASAITSAWARSHGGGGVPPGRRRADPVDQLVRERANARIGKLRGTSA